MLALGIDTSTPQVSVALGSWSARGESGPGDGTEPRLLSRHDQLARNAHGEVLAPALARVLEDAGRSRGDIDVIGVGLGPGPFTGLRVGIVTAAALGDALAVPVYGRCSLDTIAEENVGAEEPFLVATDARRHQVYWAAYTATGSRSDGPDISPPEALAERFRGRVERVIGPAAAAVAAFGGVEVAGVDRWPSATRMAADAIRRAWNAEPQSVLEPMYLRSPDARPPGPPKKVTAR